MGHNDDVTAKESAGFYLAFIATPLQHLTLHEDEMRVVCDYDALKCALGCDEVNEVRQT